MVRSHALALALAVSMIGGGVAGNHAAAQDAGEVLGATGESYPNMPAIASIGQRIGKYLDIPASPSLCNWFQPHYPMSSRS